MPFSPLQVGYIANTTAPVPVGDYVKTVLDLFDQKSDLEVVPIAGAVLKRLHNCLQEQMKTNLDREIRQWIGEASLADDLTLVDLRF
ncbi:MAG: hypothetical protein LBC31_12830 [Treponema sp.]|jgi:hypothetical protein|nr:hypothetical protein [Treponema sp.]